MREKDHFETVKIRQSVKKQIMNDCKQLFLEHHPEMKHIPLSYNYMIAQLIKYYLEN